MRDLHQIMKDIQPYIDFIFEHEDEFMKYFCSPGATDVVSMSFGNDELQFTFIKESGQHIQDTITTDNFVSWMRKVRGEYP